MTAADIDLRPYMEVLRERMDWYEAEKDDTGELESNASDDSNHGSSDLDPRAITETVRAITLKKQADSDIFVGTDLAGRELCHIQCSDRTMTVSSLITMLADRLGEQNLKRFTVLDEDRVLESHELVGDHDVLFIRQELKEPTVFVCGKAVRVFADLSEARVKLRLPDTELLQAVQEVRSSVTLDPEPVWLVYSKAEVSMASASGPPPVVPIGVFPPAPNWALPQSARQWGGPRCDIWSAHVRMDALRPLLDKHAALTNDRPIPRYQMIVDPNRFVRTGADGTPVWVPCEFDVAGDGTPTLVGGPRSHAYPELAEKVATPVLAAALPLLARLQRPRLLLERRRLQVVFKAQRIIVPPKTNDDADSEYVGLWHMDGQREHIVAVALYYYKVDSTLRGGAMEFCGREPIDVLGYGDCSNNISEISGNVLREGLRVPNAKLDDQTAIQNAKVPVSEGTLLVFSNYQVVHRVLRMVNESMEHEASRDFVALFIVDPASKPLVPARCHLAESYMLSRTLRAAKLPCVVSVKLILHCLGQAYTEKAERQNRNKMLLEQLQPRGCFGCAQNVYATGNGCFTMIGWLQSLLREDEHSDFKPVFLEKSVPWEVSGAYRFSGLNLPPQQLGRGMSELLSIDSSDLEQQLEDAIDGGDHLNMVEGQGLKTSRSDIRDSLLGI
eukprot:TRINITY_DN2642_c0_g2_i1.p1 TRINITY_DN2642_c0_g2~~TRINITY_DN2642_c0_g2_i1.p1  ORF type:complete len:671 (+),score=87.26 TRINITY_DN2642_c0_g2_i1:63-2075(+)